MMKRYSSVLIGVLNKKNIHILLEYQQLTPTVILSGIHFNELNNDDFKSLIKNIELNKILFIPSPENISFLIKEKKNPNYALIVDWFFKQPKSISLTMENNTLLHISHKNDDWHNTYDGGLGYVVSAHEGPDTIPYGYSTSLSNNKDKLLLKEFDGYSLKSI